MSKDTVLIRPWALFLAGDNPMQAEECSGMGLNSNYFCRVCHVGGQVAHKQSDEGFAELLKVA
jgi:cytochrome c peroxidase